MSNNYFRFKQFLIQQDRCAMKVGTDGVLLGAWVKIEGAKSILDIGTGSGLIALMLAQRSDCVIHGIEIEKNAAQQANENAAKSPWRNRISIFNQSLQDFRSTTNRYDLIVSNPPYFERSMLAPDQNRSVARHNHFLTQQELLDGVKKLLRPHGRLALILPFEGYRGFRELALSSGFFEIRNMSVKPTPEKPANRVLGEFADIPGRTDPSEIVIEKYGRHGYSEEYIDLTKYFYLKF